jgi:hypothetical protein
MERREAERSRMRKGLARLTMCLFLTKDLTEIDIDPAMIEVLRNLRRATSGICMATSVAEDSHLRRDQGQSQSKIAIGSCLPVAIAISWSLGCSTQTVLLPMDSRAKIAQTTHSARERQTLNN